jgi:hypothetical protein
MHLRVEADTSSLVEPVDDLLGPFAVAAVDGGVFLLHVGYGDPNRVSLPGNVRVSWEGNLPGWPYTVIYTDEEYRVIELPGAVRLDANLPHRRAQITVKPGSESHLEYACILPALYDFLAEAGHFIIHAASLVVPEEGKDRAILLTGPSGSGKTTTALALVEQGLHLLADDATFLHRPDDSPSLVVWGLPRALKIHRNTLSMLPWLGNHPHSSAASESEVLVDLGSIASLDLHRTVSPGLILFLDDRNETEHRLDPMDPGTALVHLSQENLHPAEGLGARPMRGAFELLGWLVHQVPTYRLSVGPELTGLADSITPLLRG